MKNIRHFIEQWDLPSALALTLRMSVSHSGASLLPTSNEDGPIPVNRLQLLQEHELDEDALWLDGKVSFRRLVQNELPSDKIAQLKDFYAVPQIEQKRAPQSLLPKEGSYTETWLQIKSEARLNEPIVILMNNSLRGLQRLNLHVRRGATAQVIVLSQFDLASSQCLNVEIEEHAKLELICLPMQPHEQAQLLLRADLGEAASLRLFQPLLEGSANLQNLIHLNGDRSRAETFAPCLAEGKEVQWVESNLFHHGKQSYSRIHNHGVLMDQAKGQFFGRQILPAYTREIDCYQESRFLVMSDEAKAHANPILVIENNEVQAGHAATVAKLDRDQLYYLQSRGLPETQAKRLMTMAFLQAYLDELQNEALREGLSQWLLQKVDAL